MALAGHGPQDAAGPTGPGGSLGRQLVLATLGFCLVFTLLTVAVRMASAWVQQRESMRTELTLIEQVFQRTLSKAVWEMDRESLLTHLDGAAQVASVGRVRLALPQTQGTAETLERVRAGWSPSPSVPSMRHTLYYEPYAGARESVGELMLDGDARVLWARLQGEVASIVLTQVIQSLLLAGLIMWRFNKLVTVHVQHVARHLGGLTPQTLGAPLRLARAPARRDELSLLEAGVNELQGSLSAYLERQRRDERELAAHRDRLADLVRERTGELEALSSSQQLVLGLSHRLIRAPFAEFDAHQLNALREVAQRLQVDCALWYRRDAADRCRLGAQWQAEALPAPPALVQVREGSPLQALLTVDEPVAFDTHAARALAIERPGDAPLATLAMEATAFAPLRSGEGAYGFLVFGRRAAGGWRADERALLAMTAQMLLHSARHKAQLSDILATQEALEAANERLEELSRIDPLTGLPNRRHFDEAQATEFRRARRSGLPLTVLLCDVDFFKRYNDRYGHAVGDACLRTLGQVLRETFARAGELPARIGGEEFAVLLPGLPTDQALPLAERLRAAVADLGLAHAGSDVAGHVTLSIGVAELEPATMDRFDALLLQADRALYRAKAEGRNRVVLASSLPTPTEAAP